jgi:Ca2+-binding EF-hand superfamily protein
MRGLPIFLAGFLLAGCIGHPRPPHWSPVAAARSEDWHSGKMLIANYDTNADGTVTRRELEAGLRQNFWQADTNRDGRLDPEEAATANQRRIALDESTAIPLIDWNQDGFIDFTEFAAGVRSQFEQLDLNGDGQVTIDEFRHAPP